jgi:hypothetical protein
MGSAFGRYPIYPSSFWPWQSVKCVTLFFADCSHKRKDFTVYNPFFFLCSTLRDAYSVTINFGARYLLTGSLLILQDSFLKKVTIFFLEASFSTTAKRKSIILGSDGSQVFCNFPPEETFLPLTYVQVWLMDVWSRWLQLHFHTARWK